jgi:hypothetical protein
MKPHWTAPFTATVAQGHPFAGFRALASAARPGNPVLLPTNYRPDGLPYYWRDETSGVLAVAIKAYVDGGLRRLTTADARVALVKQYCVHWVNAPCWEILREDREGLGALRGLREAAEHIVSTENIANWIDRALDLGLDPL